MTNNKSTNLNSIRLLVVDDEEDICEILRFNLEAEGGYVVRTATSAEEAMTLDLTAFDLFLLDVMMGEMSGFELARRLKSDPATAETPIIFLTARDTENDTITGLALGADDYIAKPFSIREVLLRIRNVLKRINRSVPTSDSQSGELVYKGIRINTDSKTVSVDGKEVSFTKIEYELILLFLSHKGHVFTRQELIRQIWPDDVTVLFRTVDVNITRIRKKIGRYASCIATRQGYGYFFSE